MAWDWASISNCNQCRAAASLQWREQWCRWGGLHRDPGKACKTSREAPVCVPKVGPHLPSQATHWLSLSSLSLHGTRHGGISFSSPCEACPFPSKDWMLVSPPNLLCWNLPHTGMVLGGGVFGMCLGNSSGFTLRTKTVVLIKATSKSSLTPSAMWRPSKETAIYEPGRRLSPDIRAVGVLILDSSASRIVRNKCVSLSHLVNGTLVTAAKLMEEGTLTVWPLLSSRIALCPSPAALLKESSLRSLGQHTAPSLSQSPTKCSFIHPWDKIILKHFLFRALCQPDMLHGELNRHGPRAHRI